MKRSFSFLPLIGVLILGSQTSTWAQTEGGSSTPSEPSNIIQVTSITTSQSPLGEFLTDSQGKALYAFEKDTMNHSNCSGQCIEAWPPVLVKAEQTPTSTGNANNSLIGSFKRSDGSMQMTYKGMPLYYFKDDMAPGDTHGQGLNDHGGIWSLVKPDGTKLMAPTSPGASPTHPGTPSTHPGAPPTASPGNPPTSTIAVLGFLNENTSNESSDSPTTDSNEETDREGGRHDGGRHDGGHHDGGRHDGGRHNGCSSCDYYRCDQNGQCCNSCGSCFNRSSYY